jgi:hypothetical protein
MILCSQLLVFVYCHLHRDGPCISLVIRLDDVYVYNNELYLGRKKIDCDKHVTTKLMVYP